MTSELPKYRRVYVALRHDILIGKYDANEKFPSEGMLMRRFDVSRITVRQAMTDLKKDGFLEARSGSRTSSSAPGAKRIAFLMPPHSASTNLQRMLGVAGAVIESGLNWSDRNILSLSANNKPALKKALSRKLAPDAIVCHNDATAMMLPRSIKVAGFDGLATQGKRKFPTIHQPLDLLAETAISTLLERIRKPNTPPRQILVNVDKITNIP